MGNAALPVMLSAPTIVICAVHHAASRRILGGANVDAGADAWLSTNRKRITGCRCGTIIRLILTVEKSHRLNKLPLRLRVTVRG